VALALGRPIPEEVRESFFFGLHHEAEVAYQPQVYPGEILTFYGNGLYEDPELGWGGLAQGAIRTFAVPGEHDNNRQAMKDDGASFMAARLRAYLDEG
jgi:hypothetical protein